MFGIANQMLAVIALAVVRPCWSTRVSGRYLWVTLCADGRRGDDDHAPPRWKCFGQIVTIGTQLAKATRG